MLPDVLIKKLPESIEASVPNCAVSVMIRCNTYEVEKALEKEGGFEINRKADWTQPNPTMTGCKMFSTEEIKIFDDGKGNPVDYEIPYTDPKQNLSFLLHCSLIPYGSNPCLSPLPVGKNADEFISLKNDFDQLTHFALTSERSILPPERIVLSGRELEVVGNCVCRNSTCVYFTGESILVKRDQK